MFCLDLKTFYRKQDRRVKDFLYFNDRRKRKYPWNKVNKMGIIRFIFDCVFIFPLVVQAGIGFSKVHDFKAWSNHSSLLGDVNCIRRRSNRKAVWA